MVYAFDEFELDTSLYELRRAGRVVPVEPQVFDVLALLLECRDRVVGKDEILERVWADRFISESTLASRMTAARKALDDSAKTQARIKTVHGRGYRFVGRVEAVAETPAPPAAVAPRPAPAAPPAAASPGRRALGRERELKLLRRQLETARAGKRQVVFVTGEAGLGKTTLVEAFVRGLGDGNGLLAATGQCLEHSGVGEAYMPVLEALGRLCRGPGGGELVELLVRRAPTWMAQMPWLLSDRQFEALGRRIGDVRTERMLREMGEALELLTDERPLVLVLEDLHWSDPSTVDLVSWIAAREEPCRLMLIGTYRPEEIASGGHPLPAVHQRLRLRAQCSDLTLPFLDEPAVRQFVAVNLSDGSLPEQLAPLIHQRTDGNPLFIVNLVAAWVGEGLLVARDGEWRLAGELADLAARVPETLRQLIELRLAGLEPQARLALECASVVGVAFSSAAVAAGCEHPEEQVEQRLMELADEGKFLRARGTTEWPDGTIATRFEFIHSLYRDVLYDRVPAGTRAGLHRRIGERLERAYAGRARERAAELALHLERGREPRRAAQWLRVAGERALDRSAHREAVVYFQRALAILGELPDDDARARAELEIRILHAPSLASINGWAEPAVEDAFRRAHALCERLGDASRLFPVLYGIAEMHELRGEFAACQEVLAWDDPDPAWPRLEFHEMLACSTFHQGRFDEALDHAEIAMAAYDPERSDPYTKAYGESAAVRTFEWKALSLWFKGYPDQALERMREGLALAEGPGLLYSLSSARAQMTSLCQLRREVEPTLRWARETTAVASRHGFAYRVAMGRMLEGWALARQGEADRGIVQIRDGLELSRRVGIELDRPYYLALLAEAFGAGGRVDDGLAAIHEALEFIRTTRSYFYEAELHRLEGELLLIADPPRRDEAEACFRRGLEVAKRQGSLSLELRTAVSLGALWRESGRGERAVELVSAALDRLSEGRRTPDATRAAALLRSRTG